MQPLRRLQWIAETVPLVLGEPELERARRFLDGDAKIVAIGTDNTTVEFLCDGPACAGQQAHKLHIAVLDARQRAELARRPGPSAAQEATRLIVQALGA